MGQRLDCSVVRDLLPNYIEEMTSRETDQMIEGHLSTCANCRKICQEMQQEVPADSAPEIKNFNRYLGWTQLKYVTWALAAMGVAGIFVSVLVDFILNRNLTWSLIVTGSVIYTFVVGMAFLKGKKHKVLTMLVAASILLLPLLLIIQFGMNQMGLKIVWFLKMGIPIGLVWIAVLWGTVLVQKLFHLKFWYTLAVLLAASIPANIFTNLMAYQYGGENIGGTGVISLDLFINCFASIGAAILCIFAGRWYARKSKESHPVKTRK